MRKSVAEGLPPVPRRKGTKAIVEDRLRIGIVSADLLRGGLVERIALLFEMFDKSNIEFFLYIDSPHHDSLTERFMALSKDHFLTHAIDDATFARIVREDEIDVLLDIDLRNIYRRPAVARLKPACLQVVAFADPYEAHRWGYDAVLSDPFIFPPKSSGTSESYKLLDDTTPCPVLRPRFGFLQVEDLFDVQPVAALPRQRTRVGLSATYASFDSVARDLVVRCMAEVPHFELIVDSETLGGEKAAAALLAALEDALPSAEHHRLRVLPERSSLTLFLQQTDLLLDIAYPRSAYTVWQSLRHAVPVLTLGGENIPERLGLSVVAQMGLEDMCACKNEEELFSRLHAFCSNKSHRQRVRRRLLRRARLSKNSKLVTQKALAVVEALFEGVVTLGRRGRYQPPSGRVKR